MQAKIKTIAVVAAAFIIGSTAIASAQGGSTDKNGNAMGSERVGNGMTGGGAMQNNTGTTGMNPGTKSDSNGSPNMAPTSKQGPQGDPSKKNDAPK